MLRPNPENNMSHVADRHSNFRMVSLLAIGALLLMGLEVGYSIALAPYEIRTAPNARGPAATHSFFRGPISAALLGRS
jgi:hypothetical protein